MLLYNTLSGQKEDLNKVIGDRKEVRLFVCGLTVYDYLHIGNARTFLVFDMFVRYLRSLGLKVFYLQNITDIDDKIIRRAIEEKTTAKAIAEKFEKIYREDLKKLGITTITKYAPATKYIRQIVKQIETLISKGHAYKIEGDGYYFDISTFPDYGKLAKRTAAQAEDAVSRIDEGVNKKNAGDFALWKISKPGEPYWKTSIGNGRPGWHIEDTAITEYYFGPQYDIHGGGIDLKFPHHEAEIAQQESASGEKPFVKIWMHAGALLVNGKKMSKSLGNFVTVRDFLEKYPAETLRLIVLNHQYRSPMDYNKDLAEAAEKNLDSLAQFLAKLKKSSGDFDATEQLDIAEKKFAESMDDDFNTPGALAAIFELINEINPKIWSLSKKSAAAIGIWIKNKLKIFGIEPKIPKIPLKIRWLARKRELFRSSKQFVQSDALRKQIEELGFTVEDTPRGPFLWPQRES